MRTSVVVHTTKCGRIIFLLNGKHAVCAMSVAHSWLDILSALERLISQDT